MTTDGRNHDLDDWLNAEAARRSRQRRHGLRLGFRALHVPPLGPPASIWASRAGARCAAWVRTPCGPRRPLLSCSPWAASRPQPSGPPGSSTCSELRAHWSPRAARSAATAGLTLRIPGSMPGLPARHRARPRRRTATGPAAAAIAAQPHDCLRRRRWPFAAAVPREGVSASCGSTFSSLSPPAAAGSRAWPRRSPVPPTSGARHALPTDAELRVKQAIQSAFRVLPVQNGIILVPLTRRSRRGQHRTARRHDCGERHGCNWRRVAAAPGARRRRNPGAVVPGCQHPASIASAADSVTCPRRRDAAAAASASRPDEPGRPASSRRNACSSPNADDDRAIRRGSNGRVRLGGSITVDEDEEVNGAVVAIGGHVDINGRVREDVVAVGGTVRLGPKAEIQGDVTTVGGSVSRDPEAVVRGQVNEVEFPSIRLRPIRPWSCSRRTVVVWQRAWRRVRLAGTLVRMGLFALLAALILLLLPRGVERIDRAVRAEPVKAALVGFFAQLLFVPLLVMTVLFLAISIVGIPLLVLVPFAVLAFFVALLLGFTGAATAVAHAARDRFGWATAGPVRAAARRPAADLGADDGGPRAGTAGGPVRAGRRGWSCWLASSWSTRRGRLAWAARCSRASGAPGASTPSPCRRFRRMCLRIRRSGRMRFRTRRAER